MIPESPAEVKAVLTRRSFDIWVYHRRETKISRTTATKN